LEVTLAKEPKYTKLTIKLTESDYQPKVSEKLKEYSKKASIKGFRPGKVPTSLIQKMYGKGILIEEINQLISSSINDYIKDQKLNVVGEPIPSTENNQIDWDNQKEFEFNFNLGVVTEFNVDLSKVNATQYKIKIDEAVVNETLENLKNQVGEMEDTTTVDGDDFLMGEVSNSAGDWKKEDSMLSIDKLSETGKKLFKGKKAGDTVSFDIQKAFIDSSAIGVTTGHSRDEAENLSGEYTFTIKTIRRKKPAEVNQDFFDKIFGKDTVSTEEDFKNKLKETIEENYSRETDYLLTQEIEKAIIDATPVETPDEFLKEWLIRTNDGKLTEADIEKEYDKFQADLKWNLIRNNVIEKNEIKAEHEDIIAKAKESIMQQFGNMPINEEMNETLNKIADNYLKQDNGKAYMQTFEAVLLDKTIDFLKKNIAISEKEVSLDEFKKIVEKA
jgi:trigger factor